MEGKLYHQSCTNKEAEPKLVLHVNILKDCLWQLEGTVPEPLRAKIDLALQNFREERYFSQGKLVMRFECLERHNPAERVEKLKAFCRLFSVRSGIRVTADLVHN